MSLYYEVHVTLAPDFDRIQEVYDLGHAFGFHLGDLLLMKKDDERSHKDMFLTARPKYWEDAISVTRNLITVLKARGFEVLRYKIEDTLLDSKINDGLGLL